MVAFSSINVGSLESTVLQELLLRGFRINTKTDLTQALEKPPRLKQQSIQEFLQLPSASKDLFDVIEVLDSQEQ